MNLKSTQLRQKRFYFTLRKKITYDTYVHAIGLTLGILFGVSCLLFVVSFWIIRGRGSWGRVGRLVSVGNEEFSENGGQNVNEDCEGLVPVESTRHGSSSASSNTEDSNETAQSTRRFWIFGKKTNGITRHCDDCRTEATSQYFGTLVVLAIFYILPAVQLIWVYQRFYKITGNKDICYFNFRCLHSFMGFPAFNHLFSNVGYVFMGFVFIGVVGVDSSGKDKGIFVTMGVSLIVQGVMSGLYHDCPNQISFQFGEFLKSFV